MSSPSALILQSQDSCPPGLLGAWASARGLALDVLRVDRWRALPDPAGYNCAIVLGSYASLVEPGPDWVGAEVEWIRRADADGLPVLGICFGAQALAIALGGSVERLENPEYAWIGVDSSDPRRVPTGPWLALHEDSIVAPPGVQELARNASGLQAFAAGSHLGVQFHPEATRSMLGRWLSERADIPSAVRRRLLDATRHRAHAAAAAAGDLFDAFAARAGLRFRVAA